jgi:hypothetical protein
VAGAWNRLRASPAQRSRCGPLPLTYMRPTTPFGARRDRERWLKRRAESAAPFRQRLLGTLQALRVDRDRSRQVVADENRPEDVRLKTPEPVVAVHASRLEIRDHRGRPGQLKRRATVGAVEAHHPDRLGAPRVLPEYLKIVDQVTRGGIAALPASGIESTDLLGPLEPVVADGVKRLRQIKLVGLATAVVIYIGPVIGDQPIERIPQRQIIGV